MTQQIINIGPQPNDGQGDDLRIAFEKVNNNFSQIWSTGPVGTNVLIQGNTISTIDTNGNLVLSPNGIGNVVLNNNTQPRGNNLYYLGQPDKRFRGIFIGTGGINAAGNISANYFIGDGSMLANLPAGNYSNANVASYLPTNTANVQANYFIGDGSQLTNLPAGNYGNANVAAFLPTNTANVSANYFIGDGSQLTGLPSLNYSNANVANYLPTYHSTIGGNINFAQGNLGIISGVSTNQYVYLAEDEVRLVDDFGPVELWAQGLVWNFGTDGNLTLPTNTAGINYANGQPYGGGTGNYGNANVAAYLPTYTGNVGANNVIATGNVTAANLVGGNIYIGNTVLTRTLLVGTRDPSPVTIPLATNNSFNVVGRTGNVVVYTT